MRVVMGHPRSLARHDVANFGTSQIGNVVTFVSLTAFSQRGLRGG